LGNIPVQLKPNTKEHTGSVRKIIEITKFNSHDDCTMKRVQFNQEIKWNIDEDFPSYSKLPKKGKI
jgi:hypothetical protein